MNEIAFIDAKNIINEIDLFAIYVVTRRDQIPKNLNPICSTR